MLVDVESTSRRSPAIALLVLTAWSAAFGYVEAAVVVYLRGLYHPEGFHFPLAAIPMRMYEIEVVREAATLVLLWGTAWLAGTRGMYRFAAFAFCFGTWDLVYYLALKMLLGWPASLLEWDILFLIPAPWAGPVLAPVIVSAGLILCGSVIFLGRESRLPAPRPVDWLAELGAGALLLASFLWNANAIIHGYAPGRFPWLLFAAGVAVGLGWFFRMRSRPEMERRDA